MKHSALDSHVNPLENRCMSNICDMFSSWNIYKPLCNYIARVLNCPDITFLNTLVGQGQGQDSHGVQGGQVVKVVRDSG